MHAWSVTSNPRTGEYIHALKGVSGHSLLAPVVSSVFQALGVSATVYDGRFSWPIHSSPSLVPFEVEHGVEAARWDYNGRSVAGAVRRGEPVLGRHAGCSDSFVPIIMGGEVAGVLFVGPFALRRPSSSDAQKQWYAMSHRQGDLADPAFVAYLRALLSILVLDGEGLGVFERLLVCLAQLLGGQDRADRVANEALALRLRLEPARFVDRVWEAARTMVDERSSYAHYSSAQAYDLTRLGLSRAPDQVLVGLAAAKTRDIDPIDELVARDAFQRGAVEAARSAGDAIAGRVGDHGVVILQAAKGSAPSKQRKLLALGSELRALADQRFGLVLHCGARFGSASAPLHALYQEALSAAESALTSARKMVVSDAAMSANRSSPSLRDLREELARSAQEQPSSLLPGFERYLEAVGVRSHYRLERARLEAAMCLERVAEPLLRAGALDRRAWSAMCDEADRAAWDASTVHELFATYRRVVAQIDQALREPARARRARSLHAALDYIHRHYAEPITLGLIARIAGFAPGYFSLLFRKREGVTFDRYVFRLRIERAKHLLTGTDLDVTRVAELSGLKTPQHVCHAFHRVLGVTPLGYRAANRAQWADKPKKARRSGNRDRGLLGMMV